MAGNYNQNNSQQVKTNIFKGHEIVLGSYEKQKHVWTLWNECMVLIYFHQFQTQKNPSYLNGSTQQANC